MKHLGFSCLSLLLVPILPFYSTHAPWSQAPAHALQAHLGQVGGQMQGGTPTPTPRLWQHNDVSRLCPDCTSCVKIPGSFRRPPSGSSSSPDNSQPHSETPRCSWRLPSASADSPPPPGKPGRRRGAAPGCSPGPLWPGQPASLRPWGGWDSPGPGRRTFSVLAKECAVLGSSPAPKATHL